MEDKLYKIASARCNYFKKYHKYKMMLWDKFDYTILSRNVMYYKKKGKFQKGSWNDLIVAADTETSKSHEISDDPLPNHVCAWTISLRAFGCNIVTLYGHKPSDMIRCIQKIKSSCKGDDLYVYFHNLFH